MRIIGDNSDFLRNYDKADLSKWPDHICLVNLQTSSHSDLPKKNCIGLTKAIAPKGVITAALDTGISHIVQTNNPVFQEELETSAHLIQSPDLFFSDPVDCIFRPNSDLENTRTHLSYDIRLTTEKSAILNEINKKIEGISGSETVSDAAAAIADELYTNALFCAPTDSFGVNKNCNLNRDTFIELQNNESARLFLSYDRRRDLIGCTDPFGSLSIRGVLLHLLSGYSRGVVSSMNMGPGGAGIGFQMMFDLSLSVYLGVQPGKKTVVCFILPLGHRFVEIEGFSKNLHLLGMD